MCAQCAAIAATAVGTASGLRAWIRSRGAGRLTPVGLRVITIALLTIAVLVSGVGLGGSG
jgi:hypothetical protein